MLVKKLRTLNGYRVIYEPMSLSSMKSSNWQGYIYEHISIAEKFLGRQLLKNEVVHHLDGNRSNNRTENLLVLLRSQHTKLHNWLNAGAPGMRIPGENRVNSGKSKELKYCKACSKTLIYRQIRYCSPQCSSFSRRKVERPSKDELIVLTQNNSLTALGRQFGVSDNAVRKWAKQYKIL